MKRLIERGERIAHEKAADMLDRAADAVRDIVPRDVSVEAGESEIRLSGHGLTVRSTADARLRALGLAIGELLR